MKSEGHRVTGSPSTSTNTTVLLPIYEDMKLHVIEVFGVEQTSCLTSSGANHITATTKICAFSRIVGKVRLADLPAKGSEEHLLVS